MSIEKEPTLASTDKKRVFIMTKIPEDFNTFMEKFVEEFSKDKYSFKSQGIYLKLKFFKSKVKEKTPEPPIKELRKAEFQFKKGKMFVYVKIYFELLEDKLEVHFKAKLKGKGILTKRLAHIFKDIGAFSPEKVTGRVKEAIDKAL